jgi:FixJ family two-component response regulator
MTTGESTVFLVDDDPAVLKALARQLRSAGYRAETFEGAEAFLNHYEPQRPGCLLLDLAMPGLDGLELQRRLREADCGPPIVFLTGQGDIPAGVRAMKSGAVDFLTKPVAEEALFAAIGEALARDAECRRARDELARVRTCLASLTPREHEVLEGVVAGKLNKQIAAELDTAEKTIKIHRARVMAKMRAGSVAELARLIERLGPFLARSV